VPSLTCASATLCVAGDAAGGILTTNMPAVDGQTWHYTRADGSAAIVGLACPSTSLCVGVDSRGRVIHSTHPTSGGWGAATIDEGFALTAVSCASAGFCVAVDGHRHAFVSTHPTDGTTAWRAIDARDGDLTSISCPTASCASPSTVRATRSPPPVSYPGVNAKPLHVAWVSHPGKAGAVEHPDTRG
jgi:hypothetical protein